MLTVTWRLEPAHRHRAPGLRHDDAGAAVVADGCRCRQHLGQRRHGQRRPRPSAAAAARRWRARSAWRSSVWSRSPCRSCSAAGPAATTRPSPARTFPTCQGACGRTRTSGMPSCCGTARSTTRAACSTTPRASPSTSRTDSARWWPRAALDAGRGVRAASSAALVAARPRAGAVLAALALQLTIGISMVLKGFPLWLATAHTAGRRCCCWRPCAAAACARAEPAAPVRYWQAAVLDPTQCFPGQHCGDDFRYRTAAGRSGAATSS